MRHFLLIICLHQFVTVAYGQIKGNKNSITKKFQLETVTSVYIGLYAEIEINCSGNESMEITAEENLFEHIERSVTGGELRLDQINWIQPLHPIKIRLTLPHLARITQSTHESLKVSEISVPTFTAITEVGSIVLQGQVQLLQIKGDLGKVDATGLTASIVSVEIDGRGEALLGTTKTLTGSVKNGGQVFYKDSITELQVTADEESLVQQIGTHVEETVNTRYIQLKVKNNSWKRLNAYVVGPKPDGRKFSYGFPMRPGQVRPEKWTIGTKVYRTSALGVKKLLVEITEEDEGKTVLLY